MYLLLFYMIFVIKFEIVNVLIIHTNKMIIRFLFSLISLIKPSSKVFRCICEDTCIRLYNCDHLVVGNSNRQFTQTVIFWQMVLILIINIYIHIYLILL